MLSEGSDINLLPPAPHAATRPRRETEGAEAKQFMGSCLDLDGCEATVGQPKVMSASTIPLEEGNTPESSCSLCTNCSLQ